VTRLDLTDALTMERYLMDKQVRSALMGWMGRSSFIILLWIKGPCGPPFQRLPSRFFKQYWPSSSTSTHEASVKCMYVPVVSKWWIAKRLWGGEDM
jgi:hypothetical protein